MVSGLSCDYSLVMIAVSAGGVEPFVTGVKELPPDFAAIKAARGLTEPGSLDG
jgi:hypothetical protein